MYFLFSNTVIKLKILPLPDTAQSHIEKKDQLFDLIQYKVSSLINPLDCQAIQKQKKLDSLPII